MQYKYFERKSFYFRPLTPPLKTKKGCPNEQPFRSKTLMGLFPWFCVLLHKLLYSTCGIKKFLFAGEEGM